SMINRDKMFVEVNVDEVDIREVAIGQRATVRFDAYPDLELSARVSDISRVATVQGGVTVVKVTLELLKFDKRIKPGFSAEVEITVAKAHDVLKVPVEAIVEKDGRYFVTQVTEDDLKPVSVKVGISDEEHVEILSGLREGDKILANNYKLFERLKKSEERGEKRLPGMMPFASPRSSRRR
ncbi:MAG TPA: efflux RND transporter periplasmic adaptor subunit, partial [Candidatus Aerophobetes bacterium]|nr:efflux RND transporter periplasmic adaptor subunit [Candidatus Aerophobetes bacterium]